MEADDQLETQEYLSRPLGELPRLWVDLGQMTEEFFISEVLHTSAPNTFYGVLVLTLVSTLTAVLQSLLGSVIQPPGNASLTIQNAFFIALTFTPLSFYLYNALTFWSARVFGGKGAFGPQAYLNSLFAVPLGAIACAASFSSLLPVFGFFIFLVFLLGTGLVYLFLTVRSFKAVHNFAMDKATSAMLLPIIFVCLAPFCIAGIAMLMNPGSSVPNPVTP